MGGYDTWVQQKTPQQSPYSETRINSLERKVYLRGGGDIKQEETSKSLPTRSNKPTQSQDDEQWPCLPPPDSSRNPEENPEEIAVAKTVNKALVAVPKALEGAGALAATPCMQNPNWNNNFSRPYSILSPTASSSNEYQKPQASTPKEPPSQTNTLPQTPPTKTDLAKDVSEPRPYFQPTIQFDSQSVAQKDPQSQSQQSTTRPSYNVALWSGFQLNTSSPSQLLRHWSSAQQRPEVTVPPHVKPGTRPGHQQHSQRNVPTNPEPKYQILQRPHAPAKPQPTSQLHSQQNTSTNPQSTTQHGPQPYHRSSSHPNQPPSLDQQQRSLDPALQILLDNLRHEADVADFNRGTRGWTTFGKSPKREYMANGHPVSYVSQGEKAGGWSAPVAGPSVPLATRIQRGSVAGKPGPAAGQHGLTPGSQQDSMADQHVSIPGQQARVTYGAYSKYRNDKFSAPIYTPPDAALPPLSVAGPSQPTAGQSQAPPQIENTFHQQFNTTMYQPPDPTLPPQSVAGLPKSTTGQPHFAPQYGGTQQSNTPMYQPPNATLPPQSFTGRCQPTAGSVQAPTQHSSAFQFPTPMYQSLNASLAPQSFTGPPKPPTVQTQHPPHYGPFPQQLSIPNYQPVPEQSSMPKEQPRKIKVMLPPQHQETEPERESEDVGENS